MARSWRLLDGRRTVRSNELKLFGGVAVTFRRKMLASGRALLTRARARHVAPLSCIAQGDLWRMLVPRGGRQQHARGLARRHRPYAERVLLAAVCVAILCGGTVHSRSAWAWRRVQEVVRGTADTLEKGRLTVGVFAPAMVGVTDSLTIASHPVLDLLLVPNLDIRLRLRGDDVWVFSGYGGYIQGFQPVESSGVAGRTSLGVMATRYLVDRVALTAGVGWSGRIDRTVSIVKTRNAAGSESVATTSDLTLDHGVGLFANVAWMLDERHMILVNSHTRLAGFGAEDVLLTGVFVFARGSLQIAVGASVGSFGLRSLQVTESQGVVATWPVMPYLDLWWDF